MVGQSFHAQREVGNGGRYWVRTSDLFGVNEARYHCANRPQTRCASTTLSHPVRPKCAEIQPAFSCRRLETMCRKPPRTWNSKPDSWVCPAELISIELKRSYVYPYSRRSRGQPAS